MNRRSPAPQAGGLAKLSHILSQSVQGDLNPRIHHGKVAGCQVTSWTQTVPAAGVEPAAFRSSGGRSYRLSYTGITREPAVGIEPTHTALRERCSARLSFAGLETSGPGTLAWTARQSVWPTDKSVRPTVTRVAGGSRTHTAPVHSRVPLPLWVRPQYPWQESNLHEPPPSQGGVPPPHPRDSNPVAREGFEPSRPVGTAF